jgi:hypothetical protein
MFVDASEEHTAVTSEMIVLFVVTSMKTPDLTALKDIAGICCSNVELCLS